MSAQSVAQRLFTALGLLGLCWLFASRLSAESLHQQTTDPQTQPYYVEIVQTHARAADSRAAVEALSGANVLRRVDGIRSFYIVELSAENARLLQAQRNPAIGIIEPIPSYHLASETYPYSHTLMQSRTVWDNNFDSELDPNANAGGGTSVCIIDTGIAPTHKDFIGTSITGTSQITGEDWRYDPSGHGTHIGGIIAARLQGAGIVGIAPEADLHLVKMFNYGENWVNGQSNLAQGLLSCYNAGAKIVNLSIASCSPPSQLERLLLEDLYLYENMLFISSAGNSTDECTHNSFAYPASFDAVISVGAINKKQAAAPFSQENNKLELVAPGVDILSLAPNPTNGGIPRYDVTDSTGNTYSSNHHVAQSAYGTVQATLQFGGLCNTTEPQPTWQNSIVLCERGTSTFGAKVANTEANGARGTILYNNTDGELIVGLGADSSKQPVIALTQADGVALRQKIGTTVTIVSDLGIIAGEGGYQKMSGTSQAAAHIAGAAAIVWSACPDLTNNQLRAHLSGSAESPTASRSSQYGFGIVRIADTIKNLFDGIDTYNGIVELGSDASNVECAGPSAVQLHQATLQPATSATWIVVATALLSAATVQLLRREYA